MPGNAGMLETQMSEPMKRLAKLGMNRLSRIISAGNAAKGTCPSLINLEETHSRLVDLLVPSLVRLHELAMRLDRRRQGPCARSMDELPHRFGGARVLPDVAVAHIAQVDEVRGVGDLCERAVVSKVQRGVERPVGADATITKRVTPDAFEAKRRRLLGPVHAPAHVGVRGLQVAG